MKLLQFFVCVLLLTIVDRPPQLIKVFPPDGSRLIQVETIGAELDFTKGERVCIASLQLLVDKVDVTTKSTIVMTRDWPPIFVSISYNPIHLQPGIHHAEISFQTYKSSKVLWYSWFFTILQQSY